MLTFATNHAPEEKYALIRLRDTEQESANLEVLLLDGKLIIAMSGSREEVELYCGETISVHKRHYDEEEKGWWIEPVYEFHTQSIQVADMLFQIRNYKNGKTVRILKEAEGERHTFLYLDVHETNSISFAFGGVNFAGLRHFVDVLLG